MGKRDFNADFVNRIADSFMKKIWLVRHAESTAQTEEEYGYDTGLSVGGRMQALSLLAPLGKMEFDEVFLSPLKRARETFEVSGLPKGNVKFDSRIIELMPPELYSEIFPYEKLPDYGEPDTANAWLDIPEIRVNSFLKNLYSTEAENILVFSHSGCLSMLLNLFLAGSDASNKRASDFKLCVMENAAISAFTISENRREEILLFWNNTAHLQGIGV